MSNFSNIGFNITTQEEFLSLLNLVYSKSKQVKINEGAYSIFTDTSGAELFLQLNKKNELLGANPHFKGKSKRTVCLTNIIERLESELDGAFECWAAPTDENDPESGEYPFVFDVPDFKTIGTIDFPKNYDIQLTAFAQELSIYESEKEYEESQSSEFKWATQSFVPSGLFSLDEEEKDSNPPEAIGIFSGVIKQFERKRNELSNEEYYWFLVDTLGGEVDIVADIRYIEKEPIVNGIVQGQFWLSGQIINAPERKLIESKTFFQKLFGR